jgi:hypothetical protein
MNRKKLSNVAVDAVFDSVSVQLTREAKSGLFCSISMHGKSLSNLVENF